MKPNIIKKKLTELTKEEFETNMKALMRWAKDNGYYMCLRNYLDDKDTIFKEINEKSGAYNTYEFGEALGLMAFVHKKYKEHGHYYWETHIRELFYQWKKYYEECLQT